MEITFIGIVSLLITLVALFLHRGNILLYGALFFSGFSGSSVLNVGSISLQPSFYFFGLYFVVSLFRFKRAEIRLEKPMLIFFCYCALSLVFPLLFGGNDVIVMGQEGEYIPLAFSFYNIIHICYLLFGLFFLNTLLKYKSDGKMQKILLKSFKWGFYAVVLVCLYQRLAFRFGLPFDTLFRQGVNGNIQGTRLYGPCIEASMLCYYLIPAIFVVLQNRPKWWEIVFVIAALAIGVMTYSSTFLIGIILLILCEIPSVISFLGKKHRGGSWFFIMLVPFVALIVLVVFQNELSYPFEALMDKLNQKNTSGIERTESLKTMMLLGLRFPFGLGFGSARSKDLFSTWICNIGIFGMLLYVYFLADYCAKASKAGRLLKALPYMLTVILMMISVPEPYNLFIWYLVFYGYTSKEKVNERNYSCGRERDKIIPAYNGDEQAALARVR